MGGGKGGKEATRLGCWVKGGRGQISKNKKSFAQMVNSFDEVVVMGK